MIAFIFEFHQQVAWRRSRAPELRMTFDSFHTVRECHAIWQGDFVGLAVQD
jgi:hypothetical protein